MNCSTCFKSIDQFTIQHRYNHPYYCYGNCCCAYIPNPARKVQHAICDKCCVGDMRAYVKSYYNFAERSELNLKISENKTLVAQRDAARNIAKDYEQFKSQIQNRNKILNYFVSDDIVESMKTFTLYIDDLRKEKLELEDVVGRTLKELIKEMNQRTSELIEQQTDKIVDYLRCEQQDKNLAIQEAQELCRRFKEFYSTARLSTAHKKQQFQTEASVDLSDRERIYSDAFINKITEIFASEIIELTQNEGAISKLRRDGERLADRLRGSSLRSKLSESVATEVSQMSATQIEA